MQQCTLLKPHSSPSYAVFLCVLNSEKKHALSDISLNQNNPSSRYASEPGSSDLNFPVIPECLCWGSSDFNQSNNIKITSSNLTTILTPVSRRQRMTIRAKQTQILKTIIFIISINMIKLQRYWFTRPLSVIAP